MLRLGESDIGGKGGTRDRTLFPAKSARSAVDHLNQSCIKRSRREATDTPSPSPEPPPLPACVSSPCLLSGRSAPCSLGRRCPGRGQTQGVATAWSRRRLPRGQSRRHPPLRPLSPVPRDSARHSWTLVSLAECKRFFRGFTMTLTGRLCLRVGRGAPPCVCEPLSCLTPPGLWDVASSAQNCAAFFVCAVCDRALPRRPETTWTLIPVWG